MAERPTVDWNKLPAATKILLVAGLLYFIDLFLPWYKYNARIPTVSADLGLASPVKPASFPSRRLYEKRFYYDLNPQDTCQTTMLWTDPTADNTFTDTLTTWTPDRDAIRKHRDERLADSGIEGAVLERDSRSAIRYRTLGEEELRSSLQR